MDFLDHSLIYLSNHPIGVEYCCFSVFLNFPEARQRYPCRQKKNACRDTICFYLFILNIWNFRAEPY